MENTYWQKQNTDNPLFPDILWNKPENRAHAGKLLIVGGNSHGVAAPGQAYSAAGKAGIGTIRLILPNSVAKTLGKLVPEAEFAPSTPSGSFSRQALSQLLENAAWSDGVLLAGDFGKNSETAILLEAFINIYKGLLGLSGDTLDYFIKNASSLTSRPNTLLVADIARLQKLAQPNFLIQHSMSLHNLVESLSKWSKEVKSSIATAHADQILVASSGQVSSTPAKENKHWQIDVAALATTWLIQQPTKPFEALTTAAYSYID